MASATHYRAEHEATLRVDLTHETTWFIRIVSFPPTCASVRCFPGPSELEKAKEWALGLAQWQIEDQNLGVPVPEELNWEAVGLEGATVRAPMSAAHNGGRTNLP